MNERAPILAAAHGRTLDPLLKAEEVAALLGLRLKRVYELGIPSVRISARCLRWRRDDVEDWLASRRAA